MPLELAGVYLSMCKYVNIRIIHVYLNRYICPLYTYIYSYIYISYIYVHTEISHKPFAPQQINSMEVRNVLKSIDDALYRTNKAKKIAHLIGIYIPI
jgi:hypothetical protein